MTVGEPPTHTAPPRELYRQDIDGLRALAVLSVVFFHAGVSALHGGFVGVDIFFVISGYLIGAHIYRDIVAGHFALRRFYYRRVKRILPALLALLVVCYVIALVLLSPEELFRFGKTALATLFSVSNFVLWHAAGDYFGLGPALNPLTMTWTLAVEEQFYILLPLLMLLLVRMVKTRSHTTEAIRRILTFTVWIVAALSFVLSVYVTAHHKLPAFYLIPFRAWELAAGVLMALYEARPSTSNLYGGQRLADLRSLLGLACLFYAIFRFDSSTPFPGPGALLPVLGTVLLLSAPQAVANRFLLSAVPLRWIGLISYSWYLWHWPLLSFAHIIAIKPLHTPTTVIIVLLALIPASLSYRYIEQPFRHSRTAPIPLLWRYAIVTLTIAIPGLIMVATRGIPHRYPEAAMIEAQTQPDVTCFGITAPIDSPHCLPPPDGRPAVALWGDSHANALAPTLRLMAADSNLRLLTFVHTSCPPLQGVGHASPVVPFDPSCIDFNTAALHRILQDPTIHTVILAGFWSAQLFEFPGYVRPTQHYPYLPDRRRANLIEGLHDTVSALRSAGKRTILIQDGPWFNFNPLPRALATVMPARLWSATHLLRQHADLTTALPSEIFSSIDDTGAAIVTSEAQRSGAELFYLNPHLCVHQTCPFVAGTHLLYRDEQHLTDYAAAQALQGIQLSGAESSPSALEHQSP
jgi:peptidoglycan/LPS O-acetylase OafA/YrhL